MISCFLSRFTCCIQLVFTWTSTKETTRNIYLLYPACILQDIYEGSYQGYLPVVSSLYPPGHLHMKLLGIFTCCIQLIFTWTSTQEFTRDIYLCIQLVSTRTSTQETTAGIFTCCIQLASTWTSTQETTRDIYLLYPACIHQDIYTGNYQGYLPVVSSLYSPGHLQRKLPGIFTCCIQLASTWTSTQETTKNIYLLYSQT